MINTYPSIAKFAEFVQLKDYRPPTKKEYVRYLLRFADHLQRDRACASQDELRRYYLFLRQHKKLGASAMEVAKCALRCFYREHLKLARDWSVFEDPRRSRATVAPTFQSEGARDFRVPCRGNSQAEIVSRSRLAAVAPKRRSGAPRRRKSRDNPQTGKSALLRS